MSLIAQAPQTPEEILGAKQVMAAAFSCLTPLERYVVAATVLDGATLESCRAEMADPMNQSAVRMTRYRAFEKMKRALFRAGAAPPRPTEERAAYHAHALRLRAEEAHWAKNDPRLRAEEEKRQAEADERNALVYEQVVKRHCAEMARRSARHSADLAVLERRFALGQLRA